jgi:hypothetical protein
MDLNESIIKHEFSVKSADTGLKLEDGVVSWYSEINNSIVKSDVLLDNNTLVFLLLLWSSWIRTDTLSCLIKALS